MLIIKDVIHDDSDSFISIVKLESLQGTNSFFFLRQFKHLDKDDKDSLIFLASASFNPVELDLKIRSLPARSTNRNLFILLSMLVNVTMQWLRDDLSFKSCDFELRLNSIVFITVNKSDTLVTGCSVVPFISYWDLSLGLSIQEQPSCLAKELFLAKPKPLMGTILLLFKRS